MSNNDYKWILVFDNPQTGEGFRLQPLPSANEVDQSYLHKPGDINYSNLKYLSYGVKTVIMRYIREGHAPDDSNRPACFVASCILLDRQTDPDFIPKELLYLYRR